MSTSGPLLPTGAQENPGVISHNSAERGFQKAPFPSPTSAISSPIVSPTKSTSNSEFSSAAVCEENSSTNSNNPIALNDIPDESITCNAYKRNKLVQEIRTSSQNEHSTSIEEGLLPNCRLSSSRRDLYHGSRDWTISGSSVCSWDKGIPASDMYLDGGGDGLASVESDGDHSPLFDSSTPPAARWASSLRNLLSDRDGCDLFEIFLNKDRSKHSIIQLNFLYACRGLKIGISTSGDCPREEQLISIIWSRFIEHDFVKVSKETKDAIRDKILKGNVDTSIFNQAELEVEAVMNETLYPNFLKSDLYTSHYFGLRQGSDSHDNPNAFGTCSVLPTLHEDSVYDLSSQYTNFHASVRPKNPSKLTSDNLLASALYRANIERTRPEESAGFYLKGEQGFRQNPYHAGYRSGHAVSQQDSEIQSLSSGAHTDDTKSYTDSSVDGMPLNSKHYRKLEKNRIRESASCNKEDRLVAGFIGNTYVVPRTKKPHTLPSTPNPVNNRMEFAKLLSEKLNKVKQEKERSEKLLHTFCKLNHSEDNPEEALREHAVNSLPPNLLVNKLNEKKVLDESDLCQSDQSILDNHIRNWDPSTCSPGSPKNAIHSPIPKGGKSPSTRQLPHLLSLPQSSLSQNTIGAFLPKCTSKMGKHHSSLHGMTSYSQSPGYVSVPQSIVGTPSFPKECFPFGQNPNRAYVPVTYQPRNNNNHCRRRERGQDVYSTFSSDSGNVADYHDGSERIPPSHLPKSKSMPEYMENHSVGAVSDGGSSGRRQGFASRRSGRRPTAELTDSGVSVVSDSGRSAAPSSTSERVETWLLQSSPFASGSPSHAVAPLSELNYNETQKIKGTRSTTHTVAGFSFLQRVSEGSVGRRSLCSSSTSAATCIANSPSMLQESFQPLELSRDSPLGQSQQYVAYERRKNKGGNGSSSSKSTGQGSCHGDGTGSNGSTLKKPQRLTKCESGGVSSSNSTTPSQGPSTASAGPPTQSTTIIYNFSDDEVPFMVKVSTRPVLLKKFKEHLPKKGIFRFYFKKVCEDVGTVFEEITDESEILPLYDGKVFSLIRKDDFKEEI